MGRQHWSAADCRKASKICTAGKSILANRTIDPSIPKWPDLLSHSLACLNLCFGNTTSKCTYRNVHKTEEYKPVRNSVMLLTSVVERFSRHLFSYSPHYFWRICPDRPSGTEVLFSFRFQCLTVYAKKAGDAFGAVEMNSILTLSLAPHNHRFHN